MGEGSQLLVLAAQFHLQQTYRMDVNPCRWKPRIGLGVALCVVATGTYALLPAGSPPKGIADKILVMKAEHRLFLMQRGEILRSNSVSIGREPVGPKTRTSDHRTPEGNYVIDWRNPHSKFHLSLHISYPNVRDRERAAQLGASPGGDIMIHGLQNGLGWIGRFHRWVDWTDG